MSRITFCLAFFLCAICAHAAPIQIHLTLERRTVTTDAKGQPKETWLPVAGSVEPGDVLRGTLHVQNTGTLPVRNFVLTQPVPDGFAYLPGTAKVSGADGVQVLFRADGQTEWSAAPTVPVKQPDGTTKRVSAADTFRAVRWVFAPLAPGQTADAVYAEKVR